MTQKFMTSTKEAGGPTKDIGRIGQWAYGTLNGRRWDETRQDKEYRDTVKKKKLSVFSDFSMERNGHSQPHILLGILHLQILKSVVFKLKSFPLHYNIQNFFRFNS
jgi:hypothetical protein